MKKKALLLGVALVLFWGIWRQHTTPILMYHHIDDRSQEWKLSVSPESFNAQMDFLKSHQYRVLSMTEYIQFLKEGKRPPPKSVVIAFDDGYENNIRHAYPALKKFNFPAIIYMQMNAVDKPGYLSKEDLLILIENGIEIGSHTMTHAWLPDAAPQALSEELVESKKTLESILGVPVVHFAYPGGGWNPEVRQAVIDAGYQSAVSTHSGPFDHSDPFALRRVRITRSDDHLIVFWIKISGFYPEIEAIRG